MYMLCHFIITCLQQRKLVCFNVNKRISKECLLQTGQSIPRGLHVRLNLQTGEREAKLLEDDDSNKLGIVAGEIQCQNTTFILSLQ